MTNRATLIPQQLVFAAVALAAGACGSSAPRTVTVSTVLMLLAEDGTTTTQSPVLDPAPQIVLDDGTSLALHAVAGNPGQWTAQVPHGSYWVAVGPQNRYRASGDTLDLGYVTSGLAVAPTQSTPATLALNGLSPWNGSDLIQLFSWRSSSWDQFTPRNLFAGMTSASVTEDWNAPAFGHGSLNLLTGSDTLYAVQYRLKTNASGIQYRSVAAASSGSGLSMADGQPVSATLSPMQISPATLTVAWRPSAFEAAAPPFYLRYGHQLSVFSQLMQPGGEFPVAASPNLVDVNRDAAYPGPTPDVSLSLLQYGRFLPAQYREVLYTGYTGAVSPGSMGSIFTWVVRRDALDALPSSVGPLVSAVRNIQIAGHDASAPLTGTGLAPRVSWTAPELGTPSRYLVRVYQLVSNQWEAKWAFSVPGSETSMAITPGLLQAGQSYCLWISASAGTGVDAAPMRGHLPSGSAVATTETISP